jgi:hypothetical protein
VTGVPFLRVGEQTLTGAQSTQTVTDTIRLAWNDLIVANA